jgi:hypothetical protein
MIRATAANVDGSSQREQKVRSTPESGLAVEGGTSEAKTGGRKRRIADISFTSDALGASTNKCQQRASLTSTSPYTRSALALPQRPCS